MALSTACLNNDFTYIAGWIAGRFNVDVPESEIAGWFRHYETGGGPRGRSWSDGTWYMWFRNRLAARGEFHGQADHTARETVFVGAILHVGFITIVETDEMIRRLSELTWQKRQAEIARSKLFHVTHCVHPIDRTASRVSGKPS